MADEVHPGKDENRNPKVGSDGEVRVPGADGK